MKSEMSLVSPEATRETPDDFGLLIRAAVRYPLGFIGPPAAVAWLLSRLPNSELDFVAWALYAIPLAALVSIVATILLIARSDQPAANRAALIVIGVIASVLAAAAGMVVWRDAALFACHGAYECPF